MPRPLYPQGKSPWYPLDRLGGAQNQRERSLPLPVIEPRIFSPRTDNSLHNTHIRLFLGGGETLFLCCNHNLLFQYRPALGPSQPLIQGVPGVKRPGRVADSSPPSSAGVQNAWSYPSTPPYVIMAWYLIRQRMRLHSVVLS
jgi:hypothetical protein